MIMEELLRRRGHKIAGDPREADVIIINTCTVRSETEERMLRRIKETSTVYREAKLVVAGCMAEAQPYTVRSVAPNATLLGPYSIDRVVEAVESSKPLVLLGGSDAKRDLVLPVHRGVIAVLALNDGCLGNCSFCITCRARRMIMSRRPERIVEAVKKLVENGVYEIQLSSQDAGAYGVDLAGKPLLPSLLEEILSRVEGEYAIRIAMMNPEWAMRMIDELCEAMRDPRVYKFLHIPLQSGDDRVLKLMRRRYTVDEYRRLVKEFRSRIPDLYLVTDIMVGHPGEDEEAFENTLRIVRELEFDRMHVARYTPRPFTLSARMKQVPDPVKKERSRKLMKVYEEIGLRKNRALLGRVLEAVVVEKTMIRGRASFTARTSNYNSIVLIGDKVRLGDKVRVRVVGATFFDLRGEVLG